MDIGSNIRLRFASNKDNRAVWKRYREVWLTNGRVVCGAASKKGDIMLTHFIDYATVLRTINHESVHVLIWNKIGEKATKKFDNIDNVDRNVND